MKLSDIYGYGTPSNRFVRPKSQGDADAANEWARKEHEREENEEQARKEDEQALEAEMKAMGEAG